MGVTFIAKEGTYTAPAKLITKEITENNTYNASDDGANGYSSVTVNVEGGGGSSDFSTAEVTIIWDDSKPNAELLHDNCPMIWRDESDEYAPYLSGTLYSNTSPVVVEVPLYNGKCFWGFPTRGITPTGNIEEVYEGNGFLITGDGTMTIS